MRRLKDPSTLGGIVLIMLGLVFLANLFFPGAWAVLLIGAGIFFLALSFIWRRSEHTITGAVSLTLGAILLYQSLSHDWSSWYCLWPLLFSAVGVGMLLVIPLRPGETWVRGRYRRISLVFCLLGLLAAAGLGLLRPALTWPILIWGPGAFFALSALLSGLGPLFIPGAVLGGIGGLLAYQNATGDWASWSYVWALVPGFVGLGLFMAFVRSRGMRLIGVSMLGWSLVVFSIFALVFARDSRFANYWPLALVLAGVMILAQGLADKPRKKTSI